MKKSVFAVTALVAALTACTTLEPALPAAEPSIPADWPLPAASAPAVADGGAVVSDIGWGDFFVDPKLKELISRALANNRDLRIASLNVERARALYGIQNADRYPSIGANVALERSGGDAAIRPGSVYSATLGLAAFEIDLFGRVRSLSEAALQQ